MPEQIYIQSFSIFLVALALAISINRFRLNRNVVYLSAFLIFFSIGTLTYSLTIFGGSVKLYAILLANFGPFYFLQGPMLFFFVRGIITDNYHLTKKDIFHFIPFIINLLAITPYIFTSFDYKVDIASKTMQDLGFYKSYDFKLFYPHSINNIGRAVLQMMYIIACLIMVFRTYPIVKNLNGNIKSQYKRVYSGLLLFLTLITIMTFAHLSVSYLFINSSNIDEIKALAFKLIYAGMIAYLIMPVYIIFNSQFLYGLPHFKNASEDIKYTKSKSYEKNLANDLINDNDASNKLSQQIMEYLNTEKPFLKHDFSIHDVSVYFNVPQHHIYYCFSNVIQKNFSEIRKEFRINYAIELLNNNTAENISIDGIGKQSGFASSSNFYSSFKEVTGNTPTQWLKNNLPERK